MGKRKQNFRQYLESKVLLRDSLVKELGYLLSNKPYPVTPEFELQVEKLRKKIRIESSKIRDAERILSMRG